MPPRALRPSGLILVDKPAGPSSFQVIAGIRRRTGARTGHAGTLDPFATGLLLVLSGAATRLAPWLVGLDKRYVTEVDLTARTSTGDVEGEVIEETEPPEPRRARGAAGRPRRRGRSAGARRVGGEDRRGTRLPPAPARADRRDARPALDGRFPGAARLRGRRRRARPARRLGHVRALDRRRPRRPLPDAAAARGRAVLRGRRRRGADPPCRRGAAVLSGRRGERRRGRCDPRRAGCARRRTRARCAPASWSPSAGW